jgi:Leucine-rich repeat (LRR) protein
MSYSENSRNYRDNFPKMEIVVIYKDKSAREYNHFNIDKFEKVEDIRELYCADNKLTFLPENIDKLVNLEVLDCHSNNLRILPSSIGNLSNLKKLICSSNELTSLPYEINKLHNLEKIYYE